MAEAGDERAISDDVQRMRAGIRARIARDARHAGQGLRRLTPAAFMALLCAAALAPVAAAGPAGAVVLAGINVLGSVGANVLTEVVLKAIDRLRGGGHAPADVVEKELAKRLEEALAGGDSRAQALRNEIAVVLREVGAVRTAMEAAVATGDAGFQDRVTELLTGLSADFDEFAFVLGAVSDSMAVIQRALDEQAAAYRADRDRLRVQSTDLRLMREKISEIERRTRAGPDADHMPAVWAGGCPYRGLWPFEAEHAEVFYGRERLTAELVGKLTEALDGTGMVVVTGASGAGKSSLLRAGLIPALARGAQLPGSEHWPSLLLTPTETPLNELAVRLALLGGVDALTVRRGLEEHPGRAHLLARQALLDDPAGPAARRLVVVVDQFEQVFTAVDNGGESEAETFVTALTAMCAPSAAAGEPPAVVVLGVRGDYWGRCAAYPQLAPALEEGHFLVGPMSESELRRAVTGPADTAGLELEPGLVDAALSDLRPTRGGGAYGTGALPLLSQSMLITWRKRAGNRLTSQGYGASGGVTEAVQRSAEAAYDDVPPEERALVREVFIRMTAVTREGLAVRREVSRASLRLGSHGAAVDAVLDVFTAQRLVILHHETAEIAHDVLLHAWPRLRGWLREEESERGLYSQLVDDAVEWQGRLDESFLYRGAQLAAVLGAASRWRAYPARYPELSGFAGEFLNASRTAEADRLRGRRRVRGLLALLLAAAVAAGGFATERGMSAARQNELRIGRQAAADAAAFRGVDPVRALLLSVAAWRLAPEEPDSVAALYSSLAQREAHMLHPPVSTGGALYDLGRNGAVLAMVRDGRLSRWDVASGRRLPIPEPDVGRDVTAIALSPDESTLAVASARSVRLWDLRTGQPYGREFGLAGAGRLAFNAGGGVLTLVKSLNGGQAWDLADLGEPVWESADPALEGMEVSPDGQNVVLVFGKKPYRLLDRRSRPIPAFDGAKPDAGGTAAFTPDGGTVAVSVDRSVRFWNLRAGRWSGADLPYVEPYDIAFSAGGDYLATYDEAALTLWRRDGHKVLSRFARDIDGRPRFDPVAGTLGFRLRTGEVVQLDVKALISTGPLLPRTETAAIDRLARVAVFQGGGTTVLAGPHMSARRLDAPAWSAVSAAFAPDGRSLALGALDRTEVRIWDVATGRAQRTITVHGAGGVGGLAFSRDGARLAVAPKNDSWERVELWDRHRQDAPPVTLDQRGSWQMTFSPDGRLLIVNSPYANGVVELVPRPAADPYHRQLFGSDGTGGRPLAIDPGSRVIAAGGPSSGITLWDAVTFRDLRNLPMPEQDPEQLVSAAFSPDGRILAAGGVSGRIWLWDVAGGIPLGAPIPQHAGDVLALAFTADGDHLYSAGTDGVLRSLPIAPAHVAAEVCRRANSTLDEAAWTRLFPQADYRTVC
ncbi:nSTAND1 domain-containing NTPase [Nonomuraea sp. KM90]|uniref:nSTAND1 domain-containing NTPase n=1 Tax=Nonomuraea sp. KM90 TaxID=3457428 RepID=UPI003FCE9DE9